QPLPAFEGVLELANHGSLTWVDLRIVRNLRFVPHLIAIALLVCLSFALRRLDPGFAPALDRRGRASVLKLALLAIGISAGLAAAEATLRVLGARAGERIAAQRRDLGEAMPSPRSV